MAPSRAIRPTPLLTLIFMVLGVLMLYSLLTSKNENPTPSTREQRSPLGDIGEVTNNEGRFHSTKPRTINEASGEGKGTMNEQNDAVNDFDNYFPEDNIPDDEDTRRGNAVFASDADDNEGASAWLKKAFGFIFNDDSTEESEEDNNRDHVEEALLIGGGDGRNKTFDSNNSANIISDSHRQPIEGSVSSISGSSSSSSSSSSSTVNLSQGVKTRDLGGSIAEVYDPGQFRVIYPRPPHNAVGLTIIGKGKDKAAANDAIVDSPAQNSATERNLLNERALWSATDFASVMVPPAKVGRRGAVIVDESVADLDTKDWIIKGAAVVRERFVFGDRCAPRRSQSPSLYELSANPNTAALLAKLPPDAQLAIAQQNHYYNYLQNEVFQLDTNSGMWGIQKKRSDAPLNEPEEQKGVIKGAWSMYIRHPDAMEKPKPNGSESSPPAAISSSIVDPLPAERALSHWENAAAAENQWYHYASPLQQQSEKSGQVSGNLALDQKHNPNTSSIYRRNTGLCPIAKAVPFPLTTPLLVERLANKRLLFLGDSIIRNTFVTTIARMCNYAHSDKCMTRMPTYEYDIDKKQSHKKGPIGCVPLEAHNKTFSQKRSEGAAGADRRDSSVDEDSLIASLESALSEALDKFQGRWEKEEDGVQLAGDIPTEKQLEANIANILSPCYQHATFYFRPIHRLTLKGITKDPNARRQLTKGDLIPPTINVEFPQINLTLIHVSVVKPKLIHVVARHLGFLSGLKAKEGSTIVSGFKNGTSLHLAVRQLAAPYPTSLNQKVTGPPALRQRGFDVPKGIFQPYGHLANLDAILVSIGPHLKLNDILSSVHTYPDSIAALKEATPAAIIVSEYTHVLHTHPSYSFLVDKISETIKIRLALMQPDPPMYIPQRFVTQFMFRLRDNSNVSAESNPKNRPRNSLHVRSTIFGVNERNASFVTGIDGGPIFGPDPRFPENHPSFVAKNIELDPHSLSKIDWLQYYSPAVAAEGGSLTGIAGCGFYDNQHPAMRCHMVLSELVLGGLLAKLAGRDLALEEAVKAALKGEQVIDIQPNSES